MPTPPEQLCLSLAYDLKIECDPARAGRYLVTPGRLRERASVLSTAAIARDLDGQLSRRHLRRVIAQEMGAKSRGRGKKILVTAEAYEAWKRTAGLC